MTKAELMEKISPLEGRVGSWFIEVGNLDLADFVIGVYYDDEDGKWKVYKNEERGWHGIWYESDSEEDSLDEFYKLILFEVELCERISRLREKRKNKENT